MIDVNIGMHILLYAAFTLIFGRVCFVLGAIKAERLFKKEQIPYHNYPVFHQIEKEDE